MKVAYVDKTNQLESFTTNIVAKCTIELRYFDSLNKLIEDKSYFDHTDILIIGGASISLESVSTFNLDQKEIQLLVLQAEVELMRQLEQSLPVISGYEGEVDEEGICQTILKLTGRTGKEEEATHLAIPVKRFIPLKKMEVSIYLKLSTDKFVKVLNVDDTLEQDFIEKYQQKGVEFLWIAKEDYGDFKRSLAKEVQNFNAKTPVEQVVKVSNLCLANLHERIKDLGLPEDLVEEVNELSEKSLASLKKNKDLKSLIENFLNNEDFFYSHALFNSYLCSGIAQEMSWNTKSTFQKLTNACLLHDLTLDSEKLHIKLDGNERDFLTWQEIKKVKSHPVEMSEIVQKTSGIPADVDKIILNHHERPDGTGYPKGMNAQNIFPLACIFIVAEEFIDQLADQDITPKVISTALEAMDTTFSKGNFKAPFEGLKKLVA